MGRAIVEGLQYRASLDRDVADGIILAHEVLDGFDAVEPHQRLELNLSADIPLHEIHVMKSGNPPCLNGRNHFGPDDPLIGVGILRRGPAAPETADHQTRIGIRTYNALDLSFSRSSVGAAASARWTSTVSPSISLRMSSRYLALKPISSPSAP